MKFYLLTCQPMDNKVTQTAKDIIKTGAIIAGLATSPALADDMTNSRVATIVANGESIDSNSKLALIDSQISQLQAKIKLIEQKNELSKAEKRDRYSLKKEIRQLNAEKLAIKQEQGKQLDHDKAIIDEDTKQTNKSLEDERDKNQKKIDEIKGLLASH